MRNLAALIAAASAVLSTGIAALAENPVPKASDKLVRYGDVGDWTVYANKTRGDCLIVREFGQSSVQMGVTAADREVGYLGVFTKEDIGLHNGTRTEVSVNIGGNIYSGVATSIQGELKGGYSGGYILTDDPKFKRDVAKKYEMIVFPETKAAFVVDLKGTYKAMTLGRKCLKQ
jgi:hypothetical protein